MPQNKGEGVSATEGEAIPITRRTKIRCLTQVVSSLRFPGTHLTKQLTARFCAPHKRKKKMKRLLTLTVLVLCLFTVGVNAQNSTSSTSTKTSTKQKRGPVFRATKDQINQAQALLKSRGFYAGEQVGKLDDATREGLRKYQQAEGLKVTGTLNKITLEKMNIALTEKQKTM